MNGGRFLDNQTILYKLTDVLSRVGITDLCGLIRIEPDLPLATFEDRGG